MKGNLRVVQQGAAPDHQNIGGFRVVIFARGSHGDREYRHVFLVIRRADAIGRYMVHEQGSIVSIIRTLVVYLWYTLSSEVDGGYDKDWRD